MRRSCKWSLTPTYGLLGRRSRWRCAGRDHEPPCPLAPHRVSVDEDDGELRVRILFAAEPDAEGQVRLSSRRHCPGS